MSDHEISGRRPKREGNKTKADKNDLLNNLKEAKLSGKIFREDHELENVYDLVDETEYQKIRDERVMNVFVEGDSDDEIDDGNELFYLNEDKALKKPDSNKRTKPSNSNISRKKSKIVDSTKQSKLGKFGISASTFSKQIKPQNAECSKIYNEDFLKQIQQMDSHRSPVVPIKKNHFQNKHQRARFNIDSPKVTRTMTKPETVPVSTVRNLTNTINKSIQSKPSIEPNVEVVEYHPPPIKNLIDPIVQLTTQPDTNEEMDDFADIDDVNFEDDDVEIDFDEPFESDANKGYIVKEEGMKQEVHLWNDLENTNKDENGIKGVFMDAFDEESFADNDGESRKMYWLDAYSDFKIPGVVFLFGKIIENKEFSNVCVKVMGVERTIYFLPRDGHTIKDVYNEVDQLLKDIRVNEFKSKPVEKLYAFQLAEVPNKTTYLVVKYDSKFPALSNNIKGRTFSHVFGSNTACLESFILHLKLMGPCWLDIRNLEETGQLSTCKYNYTLKSVTGIAKSESKLPPPPLCMVSLNIKTAYNVTSKTNEIVSVGVLIHRDFQFNLPPPNTVFQDHFTMVCPPKDTTLPYDTENKLQSGELGGPHYNMNTVKLHSGERALLSCLLARMQLLDPDLILGHGLLGASGSGGQLSLLLNRCARQGLGTWFKMGRLKRTLPPLPPGGRIHAYLVRTATAGRLLCDVGLSARELVKARSYAIADLAADLLPANLVAKLGGGPGLDVAGLLTGATGAKGIKTVLDSVLGEALVSIHIMHSLQVIPLAFQITSICGNLLARTLSGGKSERNEYLLLHKFTQQNYITPDKAALGARGQAKQEETDETDVAEPGDGDTPAAAVQGRHKPTYLGGLVLEPKIGFYDNYVLIMDFNSLYPSIIQEYNICFTTIDRQLYLQHQQEDDSVILARLMTYSIAESSKLPTGILPAAIKSLVDSRLEVKQALKNHKLSPQQRAQLDIKQKALKITANSMYGCLGFKNSRFEARRLASLVTGHGRSILQGTQSLVESSASQMLGSLAQRGASMTPVSLNIIYGDTDSIMVSLTGLCKDSELATAHEIGDRIRREVNRRHGRLELAVDGVYRRLMLLRKKKYVGLTAGGEIELKGVDIVRRDWCRLATELGKEVVDVVMRRRPGQILKQSSYDEYDDSVVVGTVTALLRQMAAKVRAGKVELGSFVVTKQLTRDPESYKRGGATASNQPHVQVALRQNQKGDQRLQAHDCVEYVICSDSSDRTAAQRAYAISEVLNQGNRPHPLTIDTEYYLAHQIHPVISRLTNVIVGLDSAVVADALGLDPRLYGGGRDAKALEGPEDSEIVATAAIGDGNRHKDCDPLILTCRRCQKGSSLEKPLGVFWPCSHCEKEMLTSTTDLLWLQAQLRLHTRDLIGRHYKGIARCSDFINCGYTMYGVYHNSPEPLPACPRCLRHRLRPDPRASAHWLCDQLDFYCHLFTSEIYQYKDAVGVLKKQIQSLLDKSAYYYFTSFDQLPFAHLKNLKVDG